MHLVKLQQINRKLGKLTTLTRAKILGNRINAFWWTGKPNFGDLLTPELMLKYGYTPIETTTDRADIIGVGSLIEMLPKDYSGIILGAGLIRDTKIQLESATFAAVRGELTRKNLGLPNTVPLGDLGLLAKKLLSRPSPEKKYTVGLIPHFIDKLNPWLSKIKRHIGSSCCIIDVQNCAKSVIEQTAECELIISSSLHGIIVSDALNIPNVWIELSDNVIGSGFKFWDYNSAIDYEQPPLRVSVTTKMPEIEAMISHKNMVKIENKSRELSNVLETTLLSVSQAPLSA